MSFAIILATPDRIVAASDSRVCDLATGTVAGDFSRKIDLDGDVIFAMTGCAESMLAWQATKPGEGESAFSRMRRLANRAFGMFPPEVLQQLLFNVGVFRWTPRGLDAEKLQIRFPNGRQLQCINRAVPPSGKYSYEQPVPWPSTVLTGFGGDEWEPAKRKPFTEAAYRRLLERPSEDEMTEIVRELVEAAAAACPKVGGPVHIAIADADGARWATPESAAWVNGWAYPLRREPERLQCSGNAFFTEGNVLIDEDGISLLQQVVSGTPSASADTFNFKRSGVTRGYVYAYHNTGTGLNETGVVATAFGSGAGHKGAVRLMAIDNEGLVARADLTTSGLRVEAAILSSASSGGIGYATGAGGTVTQTTSKSTGVTLHRPTGTITMHNASLAAQSFVAFVLTNATIEPDDFVLVQPIAGGTIAAYNCTAAAGAGSATIFVANLSAVALAEAIVLKFVVIKAVTS